QRFGPIPGTTPQAPDNPLRLRLKYAFATYTPQGSPLTFKGGLIHTPWLDWEEALWDYRVQGAMAMDRAGYMSAADYGVGVDGKWMADKVNFQLTVVNGTFYSGTSTARSASTRSRSPRSGSSRASMSRTHRRVPSTSGRATSQVSRISCRRTGACSRTGITRTSRPMS